MKNIKLYNGLEVPVFGLGTWLLTDEVAYEMTVTALKTGYKHIDTAKIYGNEAAVGRALKDFGTPNVFVTTKVWLEFYNNSYTAFCDQLKSLQLESVDLLLLHWPTGNDKLNLKAWRGLEKAYKEGLAKAIGVSNFTRYDMEKLLGEAKIKPMVNQIEFSPYYQEWKTLKYMEENNIKLTAYSPLGSHKTVQELLSEEVIVNIANKYNKTPAQVVIRWVIENDAIVLPCSSKANRVIENFDVFNFSLTTEEIKNISALNRGAKAGSHSESAPWLEKYSD